MVFSEFSPLSTGLLAGSLLIEAFVLVKTWKSRDLRLFLPLLFDSIVITILPFALVTSAQISPVAIQGIFLSGFLFLVAVFMIYLLFTSSRALSISFASLFLLFAGLQSFLVLFHDSYESKVAIFAYNLIDEITLAAFCALCLAAASPLYRQMICRVDNLLCIRQMNKLSQKTSPKDINRKDASPESEANASLKDAPEAFLRNAIGYLGKKEYRQCIEFCDSEAERMILSKVLDLYTAKIEIPTSLQDQLDLIESKGIGVSNKGILRLRNLRNTLTMSSGVATIDQAKWAVRVVRRLAETLRGHAVFQSQTGDCRRLERGETLQRPKSIYA